MTDNANGRDGTTPIGPGRPPPHPPISTGEHHRRKVGWLSKLGIPLAVALAASVAAIMVIDRNHDRHNGETPPTTTGPSPTTGDTNSGDADRGAAIFGDICARCHGTDGGGGVGPQLSEGRVVAHYPSIDDQIAFVTNTHSNVTDPAHLSAGDIRAVVEYTRGL